MTITQTMCTSAKVDFLTGTIAPLSHTLKIALYTSAATLGATTTSYTGTTNEVASGLGYTTGGNTITGVVISSGSGEAWITFTTPTWPGATFTAAGALIYDNTLAGKNAIAVLDFGGSRTGNNVFNVNVPLAVAGSALIRIA
jgi:hypothetical protein